MILTKEELLEIERIFNRAKNYLIEKDRKDLDNLLEKIRKDVNEILTKDKA